MQLPSGKDFPKKSNIREKRFKMNILFCYSNWMNPNKGGVQRVSDTLAKYLVGKGHALFYLTFQKDEKDDYLFPAKLFSLPDPVFSSDRNLDFYHKLLNHLSIDFVVSHDSSNNNSKFFLNTGNHQAKRISLYHTDPLLGLNKPVNQQSNLRKFIFKVFPRLIHFIKVNKKKREIDFLLKNSEKLVFLSNEFIKQISAELKINSTKFIAISNPTSLSFNNEIYMKKKQVLFIARLELAVKRPDIMLHIWSKLQGKFPDWELLFLGDGPDRHKVEQIAKSLELKNVKFEGFVDPFPYYREASVICMTSEYEGFGLVLPEAMQFGLAPITFNNWCSLKDIIEDKKTGILVRTGDIDTYVLELSLLLSDQKLRERISLAAKEYSQKFQIDTIGPEWINLLDGLIQGKNNV